MDPFLFSILAKVLLCLLCPFLEPSVEAYQCVMLPPAPLHGKLLGPFGVLVARLVCPRESDIPLNTRNGGLLECNPMEKPFVLVDVPRHQCLPLKHPDSLVMYLELVYSRKHCNADLRKKLEFAVSNKLDNLNISTEKNGVSIHWEHNVVHCGAANPVFIDSLKFKDNNITNSNSYRYSVKVALKFGPYDPNKDYQFYINLVNRFKYTHFHRVSYDISPQPMWSVPGFDLKSSSYSPLFSSCDKQPNTVGTNVQYHKLVSCRGCKRDYYLDKKSGKCGVCSIRQYTLKPFSNSCIPCPPRDQWRESKELYMAYCERMQAGYD